MLEELAQVSRPKLIPGGYEEKYYRLLKKGFAEQEIEQRLSLDNNYFRQIKFQLKRKMLSALLLEHNNGDSGIEVLIDAFKLFSAGKILMAKQAHQAGIQSLQKALDKALSRQKIGLSLECAKPLAIYYSSISGEHKKFMYYQDLVDQLSDQQHKESICNSYFNRISHSFANNWNDEDIAATAFAYCKKMEGIKEVSFAAAIYYFSTLYLAHIAAHDYQGLATACDKGVQYFNQFEKPPRAALYAAYLKKTVAYIHLEKYQEALEATQKVIAIAEYGKYSYCAALYYQGIIGLHANDITMATNAIDQVELHLEQLPHNIQEQWRILTAYVALFSSRKFPVGKFLNEVPTFEKDKAGANTAILIVQMLHYIKTGATNEYIERCDALARYARRHLKGRKKILAKLLLEVSKGHFKALTIEHRTKSLVKELNHQKAELEIMPAERIWKLVMEWLQ